MAWWSKVTADRRRVLIGLALLLAVLAWFSNLLGIYNPVERKLLDIYFLARGERGSSSSIVIVAIDYESLQRLGQRWPWPRNVHADLIRKLSAAGARVISFDILFLDDESHDLELGRAAEEAGNVVWGSTFVTADQGGSRVSHHQTPNPKLRVPSATFGYVNFPFDPDGYIRRFTPFRHYGTQVFKSLAVVSAERYRGDQVLQLSGSGIRWLGDRATQVPLEEDGSILVNFSAPPFSFPIVPYIRVLEGKVPATTFKDKIVLVGATAAESDSFFTPFYSPLSAETSRLMVGVEIHANVIDMILKGEFLRLASPIWSLLMFLALFQTVALLLVKRVRPRLTLGVVAALLLTCFAGGYLLFASLDFWLPVGGPLASVPVVWGVLTSYGFFVERKEKDFIRTTLERYVSPDVVGEIIDRKIDLALGGKRRPLTILFSDIRGFTGLSERIPPETVVEMLNEYFTCATEIILKHRGTMDKFIGDAVMAFWGAPTPREDHAVLAVRAAIEMQELASRIDASLVKRSGERFRIGIGINTGDAIVGHVGSPQHMGYTAMGDPVNLASRIEGITKEHNADILISQFTYEHVKFHVETESLGFVSVKGRNDSVGIYRLIGLKPNNITS